MDFFEHQEAARKKTHQLVFLFLLSLAAIVVSIYALILGIMLFSGGRAYVHSGISFWDPALFLYTAISTVTVVSLASGYKILQLSGGGSVVARNLGGRQIDGRTTDYHERRLLNVVEEMAIAAGVPVPTVYVMDNEDGINAFAAGKSTSDAVIGITRGGMTLLSRDELQGVIGHEFSHILNGDMRLNTRLMGLLFGILFLALTGEIILRSLTRTRWSSNRRNDSGGGIIVILLIGVGLIAIGYIGVFFANLIKASISRQREFLADASAVQFTRNPDGIAGALLKIGGYSFGSRLGTPNASEASHLFFGNALTSSYFATHPPLSERIHRLLPYWDGTFPKVSAAPIYEKRRAAKNLATMNQAMGFDKSNPSIDSPTHVDEAIESLRTLHPEQVDLGQGLMENLPLPWLEACRSPASAQCVVFALVLSEDETLREQELSRLATTAGDDAADYARSFSSELRNIHSVVKIGLIDLSIPALRLLSPEEYKRFRTLLWSIVSSDDQIDLFEFMLLRIITRHLDISFRQAKPERTVYHRIHPLLDDVGVVLSTLAAMSHAGDSALADEAFARASAHLRKNNFVEVHRKSAEECGLDQIGKALDRMAEASIVVKRQVIEACAYSVISDGAITSHEAELIRSVADAIGCPIPPFVRTAKKV